MAIVQIPLEIPDELYARVLSGDLVHLGGVIRDRGGHLVKLLEAPRLDETQGAARAGLQAALKNRTAFGIALGVAALAAAAGGVAFRARRAAALTGPAAPRNLRGYSDSLAAYLVAARRGDLRPEVVDQLIADIGTVHTNPSSDTVEAAPEETEALVLAVAENTRALAKANGRELDLPVDAASSPGASLTDLRRYLEIQRDLLIGAS